MCKNFLLPAILACCTMPAVAMSEVQQPSVQGVHPAFVADARQLRGLDNLQNLLGPGAHYDRHFRERETRRNRTNLAAALGVGIYTGYLMYPRIVSAFSCSSILSKVPNMWARPTLATAGGVALGVVTFAAGWIFLNYLGDFFHINPILHWLPTLSVNRRLQEIERGLTEGITPGKDAAGKYTDTAPINARAIDEMRNNLAGSNEAQRLENKLVTGCKRKLLDDLHERALLNDCLVKKS